MTELLSHQIHAVLWLKLNRPHALNALTPTLVDALASAVESAVLNPEIRVIVLSGEGRAFCAGADLKESEKRSREIGGSVAFVRSVGALMNLIEACPKPIIAAVNGIAVAGGLELVLACDIVIAAESAVLGDAHSNYALFPGGGATARLPRKVGLNNAKHLMFTGEMRAAREWQALGLVSQVAADAELANVVSAIADKLATKSPLILARMKEALNDALDQPLQIALKRERDLSELHSLSFDRAEGLAAFREKRTPRFEG